MAGFSTQPAPAAVGPLGGFLWGDGGQALTPQQVAAQEQIANSLMTAGGAPQNVGEGLNAVGKALLARSMMSRAYSAQQTGTEKANSDMASVMADPSKAMDFIANDQFATEGQKAVANALLQQQMMLTNPDMIAQRANLASETAKNNAEAGMFGQGGAATGAPIQDANGNWYVATQYGGLRPIAAPGQSAGGAPAGTALPTPDANATPAAPAAAAGQPVPLAPLQGAATAPVPAAAAAAAAGGAASPTGPVFLTPAQQEEAKAEGAARGTYAGKLPELKNTMVAENRDINQGYAVNTDLINKAINLIGSTNPNDLFDQNTGMGSYLTAVKGSKAYDLGQLLQSIGGAEMLNKISQMKADSSNGASGISRVTQMEAMMMQGLNGSLSQAQSRDQLLNSLKAAKSQMASASQQRALAFKDTFGQPLGASPDDPFAVPGATIAAMPGGIPTVTSPEEAASLPKGTKFYDPSGTLRVRP